MQAMGLSVAVSVPFYHSRLCINASPHPPIPLNLNHGFSKSLTFRDRLTRGKSSYVIRSQKNRDDDGDVDGFYMRKSVELARKALGCTSPNPLVGCVIVKDGQIVGQGFHPKPGQPHAEVFALRDAADLDENATAYVTLEPCNHFGRTPPCTEVLIKARLKKVVVGMVDPNPIVASKGLDRLRGAGIEVVVGVEEELCKGLNEGYIHHMLTQKPLLTLRYVGKFIRKSERSLPEPDAKYTNLYVKNLDPDITEALLKEKFSSFGKILSLAIVKDEKGLSKGFGFMNYENPDDARRATEAMNGSQFGSKNLYVARAQKKVEREKILHQWFAERCMEKNLKYKGSNIYVKNIDDSVSDEELKSQFSACGTITSAKVMRDDKGKSKGFGFVCFSTLDEAVKAVNSFHGRMFHGKPLYVAFAQRKDVRQSLLQLQHTQKPAGLAGPSTAVIPGALSPIIHTGVVYHHPKGSTTFYHHSSGSIISNKTTMQQWKNMSWMVGNADSKDSSTHSGQAKHVASGWKQEMEEKSGISSAMQFLDQKGHVSDQDVLCSDSISAEFSVI